MDSLDGGFNMIVDYKVEKERGWWIITATLHTGGQLRIAAERTRDKAIRSAWDVIHGKSGC